MAVRDPASFRDPSSGILLADDCVYRYFRPQASTDFASLLKEGFLDSLVREGSVIETVPLDRRDAPDLSDFPTEIDLVVRHPRLPFISYPYEWPFEMLRDAALLQLRITRAALRRGFILKDATPFNFQFSGSGPCLIDLGSFERYREGAPWVAYTQFCRTFLNPLVLQSRTGVPFQGWLRSSLEGIDPSDLTRLLSLRHKLNKDVFVDVVLQAWLNRRASSGGDRGDTSPSKPRDIPKTVVTGLVERLSKAVGRSKRQRKAPSTWIDYEARLPYEPESLRYKERFVSETLAKARPNMLWDLGSNVGHFTAIAAQHAGHVIAMDSDEAAVGALYEQAKDQKTNILPLVADFLNPSPGQGWAHEERKSLAERGPADFALALALVHHLAIGGNVPLERFAGWLSTIARSGIVEFVPKEDPMVQRLLRHRLDVFPDYAPLAFERALEQHFRIAEVATIPQSRRSLYLLGPR